MTLKGSYTYMADAAVFKDCATGKTFPVDNNIALEQGYAKAYKTAGEPVFLTFSAHFSVQPSMEEGLTEKALVPDGKIVFDRSKNCSSK